MFVLAEPRLQRQRRNVIVIGEPGGARVSGVDTTVTTIGVAGLIVGGYFMRKGAVMTGAIVMGVALFGGAWLQRSQS